MEREFLSPYFSGMLPRSQPPWEFTYPIASATGKTPEVPKRATWQSTSELLVDRWSNDSWQKPNVSKFDELKDRITPQVNFFLK
jgi:hypothetical protein